MTRWSQRASSACAPALAAVVLVLAWPAATAAQARDLASPFAPGARRADPTALPPAPGAGMIPVVFEAEEARRLVVSQRRADRDVALCTAPCARWVSPGPQRFGVGETASPRWTSARLLLTEPTTLALHYVDNALLRGVGFGLLATSLVTLGVTAYDLLDLGPTDPPLAVGGVALAALGVSFALFFAGDGVDFRVHAGIDAP
jgi:hypothetical protein